MAFIKSIKAKKENGAMLMRKKLERIKKLSSKTKCCIFFWEKWNMTLQLNHKSNTNRVTEKIKNQDLKKKDEFEQKSSFSLEKELK